MNPLKANNLISLLGNISRVVLSDPRYYYKSSKGIGSTRIPLSLKDLESGVESVEEIDGPLRTADDRLLDVRLFTKAHPLRQRLGFLAYVGTDWKATPHLHDLIEPDKLVKGLFGGGVVVNADIGSIETLWVLSSDNQKNWITSYGDGRPITDFECKQLTTDLSAYPSV